MAQIKASNEEQRRQEQLAVGRGKFIEPAKSLVPPIDEPITPQNYPIMWGFLSFQWAEKRLKKKAA